MKCQQKKYFIGLAVIISIIFPTWAVAQKGRSEFGFSANGGISYLRTDINSVHTKQEFYLMPSWHSGLYWNTYFWEKSAIGMGGYVIQIQGREHSTTQQLDFNGNPTGQFNTSDSRRKISYWAMLFNYGRDFKSCNVNVGIQFNTVYKMYALEKTELPYSGGTIINEIQSDNLPIIRFDYALRAGLIYQFTNRFSIEATYFHGLRNISSISSRKWSVQQATVGLRYSLFLRGVQPATSE